MNTRLIAVHIGAGICSLLTVVFVASMLSAVL